MSAAPVINLRTDFFKDHRIEVFALRLGIDLEVAQIRLIKLWCWCRDEGKKFMRGGDRPGWVVPDSMIRGVFGEGGVEALLADGCAELALGERTEDAKVFLSGSEKTVRNLLGRAQNAKKGGDKRVESAQRSASGRLAAGTHSEAEPPAIHQPQTSHSAGGRNPDVQPQPALYPVPCTDQITHAPPARDPVAQYQRHAGWWARMREIHAELRAQGVEPNRHDLPAGLAPPHDRNIAACERNLLDSGTRPEQLDERVEHVLQVRAAEALHASPPTLRYFIPTKIWDPREFAWALDKSVDDVVKPRGSVRQRPGGRADIENNTFTDGER